MDVDMYAPPQPTKAQRNEPPQTSWSRKEQILMRRPPLFRWLPVACENDLVHGSWYLVAASILAMLVPVFPLLSIWLHPSQQFWPTFGVLVISIGPHTVVYALLAVGCGVFFTIGSLLMVRVFMTPPMPPLVACACLPTDEVHALWWFAVGTASTIPVTAIYVFYYPSSKEYIGALFICSAATVVSVVVTVLFYPTTNGEKMKQVLAPCVHSCDVCSPGRSLHMHVKTDFLILNWLALWGSIFGCLGGTVVFAYYAYKGDNLGMYEYSTGVADLVLLLVGNLYYLAGSYEPPEDELVGRGALDPVDSIELAPYAVTTSQPAGPPMPLAPLQNPASLPPGWEASVDPETGGTFYYNREYQLSQWDPPTSSSSVGAGADSPVDTIPSPRSVPPATWVG